MIMTAFPRDLVSNIVYYEYTRVVRLVYFFFAISLLINIFCCFKSQQNCISDITCNLCLNLGGLQSRS